MSLYFEIIREFLTKKMDESIERLKASQIGYMAATRKPEVSDKKIAIAQQLIQCLKDFPSMEADEKIRDRLILKIEEFRMEANAFCTSKGCSVGEFDAEMSHMSSLVMTIFKTLETHKQLNIANNPKDAFVIFRYYASYYWALKAQQLLEQTAAASYLRSTIPALEKQKEELLEQRITDCQFAIDGLDKSHPHYAYFYRKRVEESIEEVMRENLALCRSNAVGFQLPLLSISFFSAVKVSTSLSPDPGQLAAQMALALEKVRSIPVKNPRGGIETVEDGETASTPGQLKVTVSGASSGAGEEGDGHVATVIEPAKKGASLSVAIAVEDEQPLSSREEDDDEDDEDVYAVVDLVKKDTSSSVAIAAEVLDIGGSEKGAEVVVPLAKSDQTLFQAAPAPAPAPEPAPAKHKKKHGRR